MLLLSPIAPHIAEEIWQTTWSQRNINICSCGPTFDEAKLEDNEIEMVVQINGKVRAKLKVAKDITKDELEKLPLQTKKCKNRWLAKH